MRGLLWVIAGVLVAFWILGQLLELFGHLIHFTLLAAVVLFVIGWLKGRLRA